MFKTSSNALFLIITFLVSASAFAGKNVALEHIKREDGKEIALKIYWPEEDNTCPSLAMLSPGAGGNEDGLEYLAKALQNDHWFVIVIGHPESGSDVLRSSVKRAGDIHDGLLEMTTQPDAYKARFMDIAAAEKRLFSHCRPPYVALLGHSMGAATVMLEAGAKNNLDLTPKSDIDAFVALSPQGVGSIFPEHAWHNITKPVLMLTGTKEKALEGEWTTRTQPYANMPPGCKWLGVIDGATHMNFGGKGLSRKTEKVTTELAVLFLDSLRNEQGCAEVPQRKDVNLQTK